MDLTGKFPLQSVNGYIAIFILYDWTSNAILANPIKDAKDDTMVEAFTKHVGSNRNIMAWTMWHQKQFGLTSLKRR